MNRFSSNFPENPGKRNRDTLPTSALYAAFSEDKPKQRYKGPSQRKLFLSSASGSVKKSSLQLPLHTKHLVPDLGWDMPGIPSEFLS